MKKIILVLSTVMAGRVAAQAQVETGVQVGLKGGATLAVLDGTVNKGAEEKLGFHVGGVLRWRPSPRVAFQPELVFSQQGANNRTPIGPVDLESTTSLSYLNLPLLVKVYLGNVINIQAGPQLGLLMSAREKGQVGYYSGSGGQGFKTADEDVKGDYKGDFGVCVGVGADLKSGFLLAARLNYGLSDINNNDLEAKMREYYGISGLHNRVLEVSVGYVFKAK